MITAKITIAQPIRVNASGIGTRGARGMSAYEVWLTQEGNAGKTEADYLDYLKQPAVDAAGLFQNAVVGVLGTGETKVVNQKATTISNIKAWALTESFSISSPAFDTNGYISGAVITWPDGDIGSISNVVTGAHGITSIRYNRSEAGKYATVNIAYDGSGVVTNQTVVLTGF